MEAETLGDTRGNAQALLDTLGDTLAEVEAETLGDTRAMRRHDTVAASLPELEAETLGDTLSVPQALVKSLAHTVA